MKGVVRLGCYRKSGHVEGVLKQCKELFVHFRTCGVDPIYTFTIVFYYHQFLHSDFLLYLYHHLLLCLLFLSSFPSSSIYLSLLSYPPLPSSPLTSYPLFTLAIFILTTPPLPSSPSLPLPFLPPPHPSPPPPLLSTQPSQSPPLSLHPPHFPHYQHSHHRPLMVMSEPERAEYVTVLSPTFFLRLTFHRRRYLSIKGSDTQAVSTC